MFDILSFAADNNVEVSVRPGTGRVAWEIYLRDRSLNIVEFTQIQEMELKGVAKVDKYIEGRCNKMMDSIRRQRTQKKENIA